MRTLALTSTALALAALCATLGGANLADGQPTVEQEEHWGVAGCRKACEQGSGYEHLLQQCIDCVYTTAEFNGDATRCHFCLKPHRMGLVPDELLLTCMECVPNAEKLHLGWACTQYCAHHTWDGQFMTEQQANDCQECIYSEHPKDKWGCHVCMEQLSIDPQGRDDCYGCIEGKNGMSGGKDAYECAACSRVPEGEKRQECYDCMAGGGDGHGCAKKQGIGKFAKAIDGVPMVAEFKKKINAAKSAAAKAASKLNPFKGKGEATE